MIGRVPDDVREPGGAAGCEDVSLLLEKLGKGDESAAARLLPLLYNDLRKIACRYMRGERRDHTLEPTASSPPASGGHRSKRLWEDALDVVRAHPQPDEALQREAVPLLAQLLYDGPRLTWRAVAGG